MKPRQLMTRKQLINLGLIGLLAGGLAVVMLAAGYAWSLRPVDAGNTSEVTFEVSDGQSARQIVRNLKQAGLIRSQRAALWYVSWRRLRPRLKAGSYALRPSDSTPTIMQAIAGGKMNQTQLVVPEGFTLAKIKQAAVDKGADPAAFEAALAAEYDYAFLKQRPAGVSLEGYLFPDTYQFSAQTPPAELIRAMLDNFNRQVAQQSYAAAFAARGLTLHQGVTLASIIEREVTGTEDRRVVAQIFYTRLQRGMRLETDPTVQYAADLEGQPFNLNLQSPYNTYRVAGLPPGPIASPGKEALDAAINPASTDYVYFVSGKDGRNHFAKTFAEHERNIRRYLR